MAGSWGRVLVHLARKTLAMFESFILVYWNIEFVIVCVRYAFTAWVTIPLLPFTLSCARGVVNLQFYHSIYRSTVSDCKILTANWESIYTRHGLKAEQKDPRGPCPSELILHV